jgi:hypothetical protein
MISRPLSRTLNSKHTSLCVSVVSLATRRFGVQVSQNKQLSQIKWKNPLRPCSLAISSPLRFKSSTIAERVEEKQQEELYSEAFFSNFNREGLKLESNQNRYN